LRFIYIILKINHINKLMIVTRLYIYKNSTSEICLNIGSDKPLMDNDFYLISHLFNKFDQNSWFDDYGNVVEYGYKLNFESPWSSNVVDIFRRLGCNNIKRIEKTTRILYSEFNESMVDIMTQQIYPHPIKSFENKKIETIINEIVLKENIQTYSDLYGLGFDAQDMEFYNNLFTDDKPPTSTELFDLSQGNSEHSRHWFFNGKLHIDGIKEEFSLMQLIKEPLQKNKQNSLIGFSDNASAIDGQYSVVDFQPTYGETYSKYKKLSVLYHPTLNAETHNFPTGIAPFQGAETGVGGRIRDTQAIGNGGLPIAGLAGYCVGNVFTNYKKLPGFHTPQHILIEASNGASDYGNKFGEPLIGGFCRSYGSFANNEYREWLKPIMFSAGIGKIQNENLFKGKAEPGMLIYKLGGPAYRIGIGGGSASSRKQDKKNTCLDLSAVQRGNAEMENRLDRVVRSCAEMGYDNPIESIHDQGAGGTSNVTKEIIEPYGAEIDLNKIITGDKTMTSLELWVSEYQEQNTVLVKEENKSILTSIASRENLPVSNIGIVKNTENIVVYDSDKVVVVDLPINKVLTDIPKKNYHMTSFSPQNNTKNDINLDNKDFLKYLYDVLQLPSVCSKRFLTNKVDRSVGGFVVQQSCLGPLHTPIADNFITALSYYDTRGIVSSIGEQPLKGLYDSKNMVGMAVGEMLTNIISTKITSLQDIKCSGNWMWANDNNENKYLLYRAVCYLNKLLLKLGFAIDGGKDSLSMSAKYNQRTVRSPNQFVLTSYVMTEDFNKTATPFFKKAGNSIVYVDLGYSQYRVGGSAICQVLNKFEYEVPSFDRIKNFRKIFKIIQKLIQRNDITSCHDRSDGGFITALLEMSFAGNIGINVDIESDVNLYNFMFSEELGLIIETPYPSIIIKKLSEYVPTYRIGSVINNKIEVKYNNIKIIDQSVADLRDVWEAKSSELENYQCNPQCVIEEREILKHKKNPKYIFNNLTDWEFNPLIRSPRTLKVGIIREEGSNGDREMAMAFNSVGFQVWDINMHDIIRKPGIINKLHGLAFVGGFSYADALGSAKGWASTILLNRDIKREFDIFYKRENTFSLGVCNGCQLMGLLKWVPARFIHNRSKRFESRYSTVKILKSNSIMLSGMENSVLGIWVAHGEGQTRLQNPDINLKHSPIRYVNSANEITEYYPDNPNGSTYGVAAVCSANGRHLAMMPHPERCIMTWQNPYIPDDWKKNKYYPWRLMFYNAYNWTNNYLRTK
jgi:phosphoribosylformylglycinamidine synthase